MLVVPAVIIFLGFWPITLLSGRVAPPRPPRQKKSGDVEAGNSTTNFQHHQTSKTNKPNCVCKVKNQVETKSVGCGTDHVLRKSKASKSLEVENHRISEHQTQYL